VLPLLCFILQFTVLGEQDVHPEGVYGMQPDFPHAPAMTDATAQVDLDKIERAIRKS